MTEKFSGIDFDRQSFQPPPEQAIRPFVRFVGILFTLAVITALAFIAYKVVEQMQGDAGSTSDSSNLVEIDNRLSDIEGRLEKLELARKASGPARRGDGQVDSDPAPAKPQARTTYRITPPPRPSAYSGTNARTGDNDSTGHRLSAAQQEPSATKGDEVANQEVLQATTDKLADVAGEVGAQSVQILQNQDELNQLLSQSEKEAIPFELTRGSNPVPVGPVSFMLRATTSKTQRYNLCIYVHPACIELKDKTQNEVVQFILSRNTPPLELVVTKVLKDQVVGYLEIPRSQDGR
jgi:hypothetical protein